MSSWNGYGDLLNFSSLAVALGGGLYGEGDFPSFRPVLLRRDEERRHAVAELRLHRVLRLIFSVTHPVKVDGVE